MDSLPLPLGIVHLAAVVLCACAFFWLARMLARLNRECGQLASVGFLLITIGIAAKALWYLLQAILGYDIRILDNSLFILLAPGLVCVTWAFWNAFRPQGRTPVWVIPVIVITSIEGAAAVRALSKGGRGWLYVVLGVAVAMYLILAFLLIYEAWQRQLQFFAVLVGFSAITFLLQARLTLIPVPTLLWKWIEQIDVICGWAAFAYATWYLERAITHRARAMENTENE